MKSLIQRRSNPPPLGEIPHNQQSQPPMTRAGPPDTGGGGGGDDDDGRSTRSRSPTKNALGNLSLKMAPKSRESSPSKHKKTRSATNLAGLLGKPKSLRNLYRLAAEGDEERGGRDKENREPVGGGAQPPTPIYAQFTSDVNRPLSIEIPQNVDKTGRQRPRSFHPDCLPSSPSKEHAGPPSPSPKKTSSWDRPAKPPRPGILASLRSRSKSQDAVPIVPAAPEPAPSPAEAPIDPKDINNHLEAMLDRRNIPENQRYKMRNLNDTIKMEFIRQDWAEMAAKGEAPPEASGSSSAGGSERGEKKRGRGRTFTLGKGSKGGSSGKKAGQGTLGRHFRTRSSESVGSERTVSGRSTSPGSGILSKIKLGQGPGDFVAYLRKVTKPEVVEVGKLHKLRLLLRNETVSWTEEFIEFGGMKEIVELLYRIMEVEWREEHEDALLHETLLCLKALCTTALALEYLHSIQSTLFPRLLFMIFDPEKKGPSEFTTRNIITTVLFTYIVSAPATERPSRAATVLSHLRDPQPPEQERPLPFVVEMWRERPYRVWCKEATNVTKEVFWIFLHHLNVICLPKPSEIAPSADATSPTGQEASGIDAADLAYMTRHFPRERPPVPAAPYVGGVEWDATNYLASHLDLVNAILACTPTAAARNALRSDLAISGFERLLGGSLRLCKEKFYGAVHEGLRTWVAAAAEDGWDVRSVRYGPPAEPKSPVKAGKEAPPKIEMPRLDFGNEVGSGVGPKVGGQFWLS